MGGSTASDHVPEYQLSDFLSESFFGGKTPPRTEMFQRIIDDIADGRQSLYRYDAERAIQFLTNVPSNASPYKFTIEAVRMGLSINTIALVAENEYNLMHRHNGKFPLGVDLERHIRMLYGALTHSLRKAS